MVNHCKTFFSPKTYPTAKAEFVQTFAVADTTAGMGEWSMRAVLNTCSVSYICSILTSCSEKNQFCWNSGGQNEKSAFDFTHSLQVSKWLALSDPNLKVVATSTVTMHVFPPNTAIYIHQPNTVPKHFTHGSADTATSSKAAATNRIMVFIFSFFLGKENAIRLCRWKAKDSPVVKLTQ